MKCNRSNFVSNWVNGGKHCFKKLQLIRKQWCPFFALREQSAYVKSSVLNFGLKQTIWFIVWRAYILTCICAHIYKHTIYAHTHKLWRAMAAKAACENKCKFPIIHFSFSFAYRFRFFSLFYLVLSLFRGRWERTRSLALSLSQQTVCLPLESGNWQRRRQRFICNTPEEISQQHIHNDTPNHR